MDQRGQRLERKIKLDSLGVWLGPLFIESSYVTSSELVEGKLSKSGKNFDKVSGLLFFGQKKKVWDLMDEVIDVAAVNHSYYNWMISSEWHHLLEGKYMALNSWFD